MKLKIDEEADALYLPLDESAIAESEEVQPGVVLDFNAEHQVVGIEVLNVSKRVARERSYAPSSLSPTWDSPVSNDIKALVDRKWQEYGL